MLSISLSDSNPICGIYLLTFLVTLLALGLGYLYGVFRQKRYPPEIDKTLNLMTGATLACLIFLLAFMMSMAISYFRMVDKLLETFIRKLLEAQEVSDRWSSPFVNISW